MKSLLFFFAFLSMTISLTSCKSEKKADAPTETAAPAMDPNAGAAPGTMTAPQDAPGGTTITPPAPGQPEPAQNAAGVWHFTCAKGCPGGAGAQGTCAKCSGPLTHNQAYHAK